MKRLAVALAGVPLLVGTVAGSGTAAPSLSGAGASEAPGAASAISQPRRDPVYPQVGDDVLDALHYDLDLTWNRGERALSGVETLNFRAARASSTVLLDLASQLRVSSVTLDGVAATFDHRGKKLEISTPGGVALVADQTYTLVIEYAGRPRPAKAPVTRSDFSTVGFTPTSNGSAWTMQEPFGAYTWYAVDDQPADKATYAFTLTAPKGWAGVANGQLTSTSSDADGRTVMTWRLDSPASSYLTTVAFGAYRHSVIRGGSLPIDLWVPAGRKRSFDRRFADAGRTFDWLVGKLGRYPFDSLGILVTPSESGMETQTMITLGDTAYTTSPAVVAHEFAHQWYGDYVTPSTWRDVWMNEGMAMYVEAVWRAKFEGQSLRRTLAGWREYEPSLRRDYGPPARYHKKNFGSSNIYYIPGLMWHEIRRHVGDARFWKLVKAWPKAHAYANSDYAGITSWWGQRTHLPRSFFDRWLRSNKSALR